MCCADPLSICFHRRVVIIKKHLILEAVIAITLASFITLDMLYVIEITLSLYLSLSLCLIC